MSMQTLIVLLFEIVEGCCKVPLMGLSVFFLIFGMVLCATEVELFIIVRYGVLLLFLFWKRRKKFDEKVDASILKLVLRVHVLWD